MVSLQGNEGLLAAGLAGFAGTRSKSNDVLDRDLTAGMNAKQLAIGGVTMAKSDDAVNWVNNNAPGQISNMSNDALKIGVGLVGSEAGNRFGGSSFTNPASTALLLDGIGGVANGLMNGNGGGSTQSMNTSASATQSLHRNRTTAHRHGGSAGASRNVVDY